MKFLTAKRSYGCAFLVAPLVILAGCTTSTNYVDYKDRALYSSNTVGGMEYVEVGPVVSKSTGYIWDSCEKLQSEALNELHQKRTERGANSVFDVRWVNHAEGTLSDTPMCTTGWGWFVPTVFPGLGPWVKVTEVRGKMAYVDEDKRLSIGSDSEEYADQEAKARKEQEERDAAEEKAKQSNDSSDSETSDLTEEAFGDTNSGTDDDNGEADSNGNATESEQAGENDSASGAQQD